MATSGNITRGNDSISRPGLNISNRAIEELNDVETEKYISVLIICVILMIIGIIGNIFVLIIYKSKFKRSSARTYILALAMADISVCIVGIPYHVMDLTMLLVYRFSYACKLLSFLIGACTNSSIYILLVVGLDRYLKVCRPLKKQIIDFGDRRACLIAVGFAIGMAIPYAILYGNSSVVTEIEGLYGIECFIDDFYVESFFAVAFMGINTLLFFVCLFFLVITYGFICRKIYQSDHMDGAINLDKSTRGCCSCVKQQEDEYSDDDEADDDDDYTSREETVGLSLVNEDNTVDLKLDDETTTPLQEDEQLNNQTKIDSADQNSTEKEGKRSASKGASRRQKAPTTPSSGMVRHVQNKEKNTRKITLIMLTITAVFIIGYLPFITISILTAISDDYWDGMGNFESVMSDLILRIYLINNAANPIIYSFWDLRFRRECIALLRRLCRLPDRQPKNASPSGSSNGASNTITTTTT